MKTDKALGLLTPHWGWQSRVRGAFLLFFKYVFNVDLKSHNWIWYTGNISFKESGYSTFVDTGIKNSIAETQIRDFIYWGT